MKEVYIQIPIEGMQGYLCSNYGNIISTRKEPNGYLLSQQYDKDGYLSISLFDNILRKFQVHRLVALTFLDNINNYPCVNHKNSIRDDNRLENLEYCSSSYNSKHSFIHYNRNQTGENNNTSILTDEQALEIYNLAHNSNMIAREIAKLYNVSETTVRNIKRGARYNNITKHRKIKIMSEVTNNERNSIIKQELVHLLYN